MFYFLLVYFMQINASEIKSYESVHDQKLDSIYISEIEENYNIDKVLHAEPLYIDLIRDLGARKGEKEWNFGKGLTDNVNFDKYEGLIEYEFAPIHRLGLEIEVPFTYYFTQNGKANAPKSKINSLKLAGQYSFYVSIENSTSLAFGYIHEFEINEFDKYKDKVFTGNVFNPFFVAAKRWGDNFHSLIYTGPKITKHFGNESKINLNINSSLHYMIPGTRNFIGLEVNKEFLNNQFDATFRPQMRLGIKDNLLVGIVTGIPLNKEQERMSTFIRLIWEPHNI